MSSSISLKGLDELFDYKNRFMEDILTDKEIIRLLANDCKPVSNTKQFVYKNVFPYEFLPETTENATTYICCEVDILEVRDKTFLTPNLYVWVFTHTSLLRLPEGGVRVDKLSSKIVEKLNGSRFYGNGELLLKSVKRFSPISNYQGKLLTFTATDYNTLRPTGQPVPSNRKVWK